jgi:plastocyanin
MQSKRSTFALAPLAILLAAALQGAPPAVADDAPIVNITIKDHKFEPAEVHVKAGQPVILVVKNEDPTAEEFESPALKIEKIIAGGQQGTIRLRPLPVGSYPFAGEFHEDSAKGVVIAE